MGFETTWGGVYRSVPMQVILDQIVYSTRGRLTSLVFCELGVRSEGAFSKGVQIHIIMRYLNLVTKNMQQLNSTLAFRDLM